MTGKAEQLFDAPRWAKESRERGARNAQALFEVDPKELDSLGETIFDWPKAPLIARIASRISALDKLASTCALALSGSRADPHAMADAMERFIKASDISFSLSPKSWLRFLNLALSETPGFADWARKTENRKALLSAALLAESSLTKQAADRKQRWPDIATFCAELERSWNSQNGTAWPTTLPRERADLRDLDFTMALSQASPDPLSQAHWDQIKLIAASPAYANSVSSIAIEHLFESAPIAEATRLFALGESQASLQLLGAVKPQEAEEWKRAVSMKLWGNFLAEKKMAKLAARLGPIDSKAPPEISARQPISRDAWKTDGRGKHAEFALLLLSDPRCAVDLLTEAGIQYGSNPQAARELTGASCAKLSLALTHYSKSRSQALLAAAEASLIDARAPTRETAHARRAGL